VRKTYHPPATPCQRLLADPRTPAAVREKVAALQARLDPIALLQELRMAQQQLVEIADRPATLPEEGAPPAIGPFLAGLRVAWKDHEVRPAIPGKAKPKRERRRPDPLAAVSEELRVRFEAAPWRTGRQLLVQLQADYPGIYPDAMLRTLQRRLKIWRSARAHAMIFGEQPKDPASGKEAIGDREGGTNQEVEAARPAAASIDAFVSSLSTAWKDGEARPTARAKAKAKRGRRRPDPLVAVTEELRTRFEAAPWRTARQLFVELQAEHPGAYPDGLIRTL
jgi:hypothetical protein